VAERLAAEGFSVSLPLLPGHGTTPEDLARKTARDWLDHALAAWDQLAAAYPYPAVAGLSMGAVLALHVASRRPVPAVVALAPALYLRDWRIGLLPLARLLHPWRGDITHDVKDPVRSERAYPRYHLNSVREFLQVGKAVRPELARVTAPLLGIQSREDHVIPPGCLAYLMRRAGSEVKEQHVLQNSYHVLTMDREYMRVAGFMLAFLARYLPDSTPATPPPARKKP